MTGDKSCEKLAFSLGMVEYFPQLILLAHVNCHVILVLQGVELQPSFFFLRHPNSCVIEKCPTLHDNLIDYLVKYEHEY